MERLNSRLLIHGAAVLPFALLCGCGGGGDGTAVNQNVAASGNAQSQGTTSTAPAGSAGTTGSASTGSTGPGSTGPGSTGPGSTAATPDPTGSATISNGSGIDTRDTSGTDPATTLAPASTPTSVTPAYPGSGSGRVQAVN
jgi:hypothetical protein